VKQDYYDGLIQKRGAAVAAPLLADECRKADAEIKILRANLTMASRIAGLADRSIAELLRVRGRSPGMPDGIGNQGRRVG